MEKKYDMNKFAPIISDMKYAEQIYTDILNLEPQKNKITLQMEDIITMTTIVAKRIFGPLYDDLGNTLYHQNIKIEASEDVKFIVGVGIKDYMKSK